MVTIFFSLFVYFAILDVFVHMSCWLPEVLFILSSQILDLDFVIVNFLLTPTSPFWRELFFVLFVASLLAYSYSPLLEKPLFCIHFCIGIVGVLQILDMSILNGIALAVNL